MVRTDDLLYLPARLSPSMLYDFVYFLPCITIQNYSHSCFYWFQFNGGHSMHFACTLTFNEKLHIKMT